MNDQLDNAEQLPVNSVPDAEHGHPYVMSVPTAGRIFFGLGRGASYEAARRGEFPTIRIGRKLLVLVKQCKKRVEGQ